MSHHSTLLYPCTVTSDFRFKCGLNSERLPLLAISGCGGGSGVSNTPPPPPPPHAVSDFYALSTCHDAREFPLGFCDGNTAHCFANALFHTWPASVRDNLPYRLPPFGPSIRGEFQSHRGLQTCPWFIQPSHQGNCGKRVEFVCSRADRRTSGGEHRLCNSTVF